MRPHRLDHIVLTVADVERSCAFYGDVLGMRVVREAGRTALLFGEHRIHLHQEGRELAPRARVPAPGSGDVCLAVEAPLDEVAARLGAHGIPVELGPVPRAGGRGPIVSLYVRDPDGNLVELANDAPGGEAPR
jgi:catechol 2,3-dioxygenase-like lactoylglutathione lyase family enzyme